MILQFSPPVDAAVTVLARLIGLAVFAGFLSAGVALLYRWYVRERVPSGLALLVGLAGVAVVLNTTPLLAAEIGGGDEIVEIVDALFNIVAFAGGAAAAFAGIRFGDHLGTDLSAAGGANDVDADVSEIVQTVGRVTTVQLPDEIADVVGYDPVPDATKQTLAGRRFLFPRRLTKTELRDRLVSRLKTDYGVGHVDVELGDDGSVEFLAVGSRAAGIGPTLPPATNAVAIRADPAHAASAGDLVQVWETDPMKRVLTGELRGVAGDVVTVAIDAADTPKLNPSERYKLVTLPVQDRPDREFAALLRAADETLATVTVEGGSALDGVALDSLDVTVAAITREDEQPEPLPARNRTLQPGDVVYVIATPEILRKVENAAEGAGASVTGDHSDSGRADREPETLGAEPDAIESDPNPAESDPVPAESETPASPADQDDGSGNAGEPVPDQSPAAEPDSDDGAADEDPLDGAAFVDTDDLPGMDSELEAPTFSGDRADQPDDRNLDDETDGDDPDQDDESDGAATDTRDDSSGASGSIDDALDSMEALDLDGNGDADQETDEADGDDLTGDTAADDLFEESPEDEPLDEPAEDPLFDDTGDEAGNDDPLDDVSPDEFGDDEAGESIDDATDDESIPFTPLDVGDEDDPLADPLTGGDDEDGGRDDAERDAGD